MSPLCTTMISLCDDVPEYHYLVSLNLASPPQAEKWVQGFIRVNMYGTKGEITDYELTQE